MTAAEFKAHIQERIAHHEYVCELAGHEPKDSDGVMILVGTSMKGIGVRPVIVGSRFGRDGTPEKFYSFSLKQCNKLLKKLDEAGVT